MDKIIFWVCPLLSAKKRRTGQAIQDSTFVAALAGILLTQDSLLSFTQGLPYE